MIIGSERHPGFGEVGCEAYRGIDCLLHALQAGRTWIEKGEPVERPMNERKLCVCQGEGGIARNRMFVQGGGLFKDPSFCHRALAEHASAYIQIVRDLILRGPATN